MVEGRNRWDEYVRGRCYEMLLQLSGSGMRFTNFEDLEVRATEVAVEVARQSRHVEQLAGSGALCSALELREQRRYEKRTDCSRDSRMIRLYQVHVRARTIWGNCHQTVDICDSVDAIESVRIR